MSTIYRAWLLRVLENKVAIQTVCECDRLAAEEMAREIPIIPHWHAKPIEPRVERAARIKKEKPIVGHILNLGGRTHGAAV